MLMSAINYLGVVAIRATEKTTEVARGILKRHTYIPVNKSISPTMINSTSTNITIGDA